MFELKDQSIAEGPKILFRVLQFISNGSLPYMGEK